MLAVVVVLFLAAGVSESVILSKCELKRQLERGLSLPAPNSTDILAQIVCHVELTSGFNTSAIKKIAEPEEHSSVQGSRHRRSVKGKGPRTTPRPATRAPRLGSDEDKSEVWTLYGLFQLSDHVVCRSTQSHSLNLCGLTCDKLIDSDTSDDIACVQALINAVSAPNPDPKTSKPIHKMISLIHQPQCITVNTTSFFAGC
ncbi:alpha-lactalbumin-like [Carassius gibelio]|uniref:alpha-lactalbumin-like n=1 Tax=Carassius gibelio TaxID=101364 RepID=UPI002277B4DE|nr:alpha-lactalbumin-like [Carassius gibelio]